MRKLWKQIKKDNNNERENSSEVSHLLNRNYLNSENYGDQSGRIYEDNRILDNFYEKTRETFYGSAKKKFLESEYCIKQSDEDRFESRQFQKYKIMNHLEKIRNKLKEISILKQNIMFLVKQEQEKWMHQFYEQKQDLIKKLSISIRKEMGLEIKKKDDKIQGLEREIKKLQKQNFDKSSTINELNKNISEITSIIHEEQERIRSIYVENNHLKTFILDYEQQVNGLEKQIKENAIHVQKKYREEAKKFYINEISRLEEQLDFLGDKYAQSQESEKNKELQIKERESEIEENLLKLHQHSEQLWSEYERLRVKESQLEMKENKLQKQRQEFDHFRSLYNTNSYEYLKSSQSNARNFHRGIEKNKSENIDGLFLVKSNVTDNVQKYFKRENKKKQIFFQRHDRKEHPQRDINSKYQVFEGRRQSKSVKLPERRRSPKNRDNEEKMRKVSLLLGKLKFDIRREIDKAK